MMKLCIVAGERPNFIKDRPIVNAIDNHNRSNHRPIDYFIVHAGQHYDQEMSKLFFKDFGIPNPHINLEVGSALCKNDFILNHAKRVKKLVKI